MTQHTPGPWVVNATDFDRFGQSVWVEAEHGNFICELVRDGEYRENANAALIAAAPELLDALNKIKRRLAVGRNVGEDKEQAYQDAEEIADFAIAKAEGKA